MSGDSSATADNLRAKARELLEVLERWKTDMPRPEVRSDTVRQVMDLYRCTLDYLSAGKP